MQVNCTLNGSNYINEAGIKDFLGKITYPLYFLDFETMQQVLPQFDGTKPYQQITFQYSLHYIENEGGELKHKAFLAPSDGTDPRRAYLRPPEKWSLFGRKRSHDMVSYRLMWARLRPLSSFYI